jgi:hypothetical protein
LILGGFFQSFWRRRKFAGFTFSSLNFPDEAVTV